MRKTFYNNEYWLNNSKEDRKREKKRLLYNILGIVALCLFTVFAFDVGGCGTYVVEFLTSGQ